MVQIWHNPTLESSKLVEGILKHGADRTDRKEAVGRSFAFHENVRGAAAFLPENAPSVPENKDTDVQNTEEQARKERREKTEGKSKEEGGER